MPVGNVKVIAAVQGHGAESPHVPCTVYRLDDPGGSGPASVLQPPVLVANMRIAAGVQGKRGVRILESFGAYRLADPGRPGPIGIPQTPVWSSRVVADMRTAICI